MEGGTATDLLTMQEAADKFKVPYTTVRSWVRRNKIPHHRRDIDGRKFVRISDIEAAVRIHLVNPAASDGPDSPNVPTGPDGPTIPE